MLRPACSSDCTCACCSVRRRSVCRRWTARAARSPKSRAPATSPAVRRSAPGPASTRQPFVVAPRPNGTASRDGSRSGSRLASSSPAAGHCARGRVAPSAPVQRTRASSVSSYSHTRHSATPSSSCDGACDEPQGGARVDGVDHLAAETGEGVLHALGAARRLRRCPAGRCRRCRRWPADRRRRRPAGTPPGTSPGLSAGTAADRLEYAGRARLPRRPSAARCARSPPESRLPPPRGASDGLATGAPLSLPYRHCRLNGLVSLPSLHPPRG